MSEKKQELIWATLNKAKVSKPSQSICEIGWQARERPKAEIKHSHNHLSPCCKGCSWIVGGVVVYTKKKRFYGAYKRVGSLLCFYKQFKNKI